jgi:hypothetical protein
MDIQFATNFKGFNVSIMYNYNSNGIEYKNQQLCEIFQAFVYYHLMKSRFDEYILEFFVLIFHSFAKYIHIKFNQIIRIFNFIKMFY